MFHADWWSANRRRYARPENRTGNMRKRGAPWSGGSPLTVSILDNPDLSADGAHPLVVSG
jgi:hypothetical protein